MEKFAKFLMEEDRHQFIFGYDTSERNEFCKNLEQKYPILLDDDKPMAVFLEEFGLPKFELSDRHDKNLISTLSREYFSFLIVYNILIKSINSIGFKELDKRVSLIVSIYNKRFRNTGFSDIRNLEDLRIAFYNSIEFYLKSYNNYVTNLEGVNIENVAIPFVFYDLFIRFFKEVLNKKSYFGIIINNDHDVSFSSISVINDFIASRINDNISMKIVTEPDKWKSYIGTSGTFVENVHDYGTVELDDSLEKHINKLKKTRLY